ncbi:perlucin-like isoform X2 [Dreissena polymorpha]|uniref:perlucin-like isoform X1 n=1 Tax=Dreissena polymorpha TaxID=45954 RepID=UPI002263BA61|nr:perlucin-like isoform X1 [Dreissena polymorpha]XP_052241233.1 perlucin-like isoform X2 [Dreissena polymorpha]
MGLLTHVLVLFATCGLAFSQGDVGCPIDFFQHGDSCYHFFATPAMSWWDAMAFCGMYGFGEGALAIVDSAEEQKFLENELKSRYPPGSGPKNFWIGAYDLVNEGTWVWVKKNEYVRNGFQNWAVGEPNGGTSENCLGLYLYDNLQYKWNDATCKLEEGFICEVPFERSGAEVVEK